MDELRIAFMQPAVGLHFFSDEELLRSIVWAQSAPSRLVLAAATGDVSEVFGELKKAGFAAGPGRRRDKKSTSRHLSKRSLWSQPAFEMPQRAAELASLWKQFEPVSKRSHKKTRAPHRKNQIKNSRKHERNGRSPVHGIGVQLALWLEAIRGESLTPFELLIALEMLREVGLELPTQLGWSLWRTALVAAIESSIDVAATAEPATANDRGLVAYGELPWQAGLMFSAVKGGGNLRRAGRGFLRTRLEAITDNDGTPKAELLERIQFWLAPFIRSAEWSNRSETELWNGPLKRRFARLLEWSAAMCRTDGRMALSNGHASDAGAVLADALRAAGWKKKSPPTKYLRAVRRNGIESRTKTERKAAKSARCPSMQSDWAHLACMRSNWSATPDTLVIAHHGEKPMLDLSALGRQLLAGVWDIDLKIDGRPVSFTKQWECVCWFSDDEADFLELHSTPEQGVTVERQVLLSRDEHFLVLADVICAADDCGVEYKSTVPLAGRVEAKADKITREWRLKSHPVCARVFPVALADDRVQSTAGSLLVHDGRLELCQQGTGGLFAPMVVDWAPERRHSDADWRALTVTEQGRVVARSHAAGGRIRVGNQHLFIYRSLRSSEEMRAVLGHHTANETVIGHVDEDGDVDPILVVEPQPAIAE